MEYGFVKEGTTYKTRKQKCIFTCACIVYSPVQQMSKGLFINDGGRGAIKI